MGNSFNNTPRYIACPDCDDYNTWFVIDMQKGQMIGHEWDKEDAKAEAKLLNSNGLN